MSTPNLLLILYVLALNPLPMFFQALQKIHLVNHSKSMAELLHANAFQQLEVAPLASPAAQILNLPAAGVMKLALTSQENVILPPKAYTPTPMAPPPSTIPIAGITGSLPIISVSSGGSEATALDSPEVPKHCHIVLTLIQPPESSSLPSIPPSPSPSNKLTKYPTIIVPELAILTEAQPEQLNQPGGGKEYLGQLCTFCHTNQD